MANNGLNSVWNRLLQEMDRRITTALAGIGVVGSSIDAGSLSGTVNTSVVQVDRVGPVTVIASENLSAGNLVDIWNDGGTAKARKADAGSGANYAADGFVIAAVTAGNTARVFVAGTNNAVAGVTPGQTLYLSTTAGGTTTAAPTGAGQLVQEVGVATSSTTMVFAPKTAIKLN